MDVSESENVGHVYYKSQNRFVWPRVAASKFVVYGEQFTQSETSMAKSFNKEKSQKKNIMNGKTLYYPTDTQIYNS